MKKVNEMLLLAVILMIGNMAYSRTIEPPYEVGTWAGFKQAAVSYTFDDGCSNQFAIAIPMFNEFGYKLTIFTVTNWTPNWTALQEAANKGHEIAGHSVTHPHFRGLAIEQQTTELRDSQIDINKHITGQKCIMLAYPYCEVGDKALTEKYYIAARGCQGFIEPNTPKDFLNISSLICGELGSVKTAADFSTKFANAAVSKGWCVLLIHGIDKDGGYSPLPSTTLRESLEYLKAHKDTFWVSTFGNVVRYIRQRNAVSVQESSSKDTSITLKVTDTLDNEIYNYPVTIRRPLPAGWESAKVSQKDKVAASSIVDVDSKKYIMFDVVPDSGDVVLSKAPAGPPA
jgi:peptidoglycan/xylan/chitin deacetylase (PgdA/CDA1 family)